MPNEWLSYLCWSKYQEDRDKSTGHWNVWSISVKIGSNNNDWDIQDDVIISRELLRAVQRNIWNASKFTEERKGTIATVYPQQKLSWNSHRNLLKLSMLFKNIACINKCTIFIAREYIRISFCRQRIKMHVPSLCSFNISLMPYHYIII